MTRIAHDAAMLGIPLDLHTLYTSDDDDFIFWVIAVIDKVSVTQDHLNRKAKKK